MTLEMQFIQKFDFSYKKKIDRSTIKAIFVLRRFFKKKIEEKLPDETEHIPMLMKREKSLLYRV